MICASLYSEFSFIPLSTCEIFWSEYNIVLAVNIPEVIGNMIDNVLGTVLWLASVITIIQYQTQVLLRVIYRL